MIPLSSPALHVVGIGASAGGLDALVALFRALDASFDGAVVVVQHLAATGRSHLPDILAREARLPVVEAADGMPLSRGRVHVIAAGAALTVVGTTLRSVPAAHAAHAIDTFLESLAAACGPLATAVVLSGAGSDGAAGALRVHRAGGRVLVQDPESAQHDSMPRAAIATGAADDVLEPALIGRALSTIAWARAPRAGRDAVAARPATIADVATLIVERTGVDLRGYRLAPLAVRVRRRIAQARLSGMDAYLRFAADDPHEAHVLIDGLPIHVTSFFRDPAVWDELVERVVAPLVSSEAAGPIRVWTPACASGEEAYSVAMAFVEAGAGTPGRRDVRVYGTDAVADVVAFAGRGVYPSPALVGMDAARRERFFAPQGGATGVPDAWEASHALRRVLVFTQHDLLADPPIPHCDLITCRNLLIYLDADAQDRVLATLREALVPGGVLFLGAGESPAPRIDARGVVGFETISRAARLYRRTDDAPAGRRTTAPQLRPVAAPAPTRVWFGEDAAAVREEIEALHRELESVNARLSLANARLAEIDGRVRDHREAFASRSGTSSNDAMTFCVDEALRLRWFTAGPGDLVRLRDGDIGRAITDLAPRHVDAALRTALDRAIVHGESSDDEVETASDRCYLRRVRPRQADGQRPAEAGAIVTFVDITTLKRTQRLLAESRRDVRGLVAASWQALYRMSADWADTRELGSADADPDPGTPATARGLVGALHPEDRRVVDAAIGRAIADGDVFDLEHRVRRPDGSSGWQRSRAFPVHDDAGEVTAWIGEARDITARRSATTRLDAAEARDTLRRDLRSSLEARAHDADDGLDALAAIADRIASPLADSLGVDRIDVVEPATADATRGAFDEPGTIVRRWIVGRVERGLDVRIHDVEELGASGPRDALRASGVGALLASRSSPDGGSTLVLVARTATPRAWTDDEAALLADVAALAHDALDRARSADARRRAASDASSFDDALSTGHEPA